MCFAFEGEFEECPVEALTSVTFGFGVMVFDECFDKCGNGEGNVLLVNQLVMVKEVGCTFNLFLVGGIFYFFGGGLEHRSEISVWPV